MPLGSEFKKKKVPHPIVHSLKLIGTFLVKKHVISPIIMYLFILYNLYKIPCLNLILLRKVQRHKPHLYKFYSNDINCPTNAMLRNLYGLYIDNVHWTYIHYPVTYRSTWALIG